MFKGAVLGRGAAASLLSDPAKSGSLLDDSQSQADFEEGLYSLQRAARADGAPDAVIEKLEALSTRARNGELTPAILAKLADDGADSTLEAIQAKDPNYFSSFKREVTSGNNARVDAALRHGADLVGALAPTAGTQAANQAGPDCLVVLVAVAAIAVYAKFYYKPDPQVAGANSSLQHDMAVDRLTTSLKGA